MRTSGYVNFPSELLARLIVGLGIPFDARRWWGFFFPSQAEIGLNLVVTLLNYGSLDKMLTLVIRRLAK